MRLLLAPFLLALPILNAGCIKAMLADGQIEATREASSTFDTIGDYELARSAAQAGLVQFEGMHKLRPDNQDALYMLTQAWTGYGFAFAEDDYERALDAGDDDAADYHKKRAKMAYERALYYGMQLLNHRADGFDQAKKNEQTLKAWLQKNFDDAKEDVPNLFWTGYAWLAKTNIEKDDPAIVAELYVGVAMLERVAELDPSYSDWSVYTALGSYHARTGMAELDEAKKFFDLALEKTQRKSLIVQLSYATRYACVRADRALYESMLNEVLQADDPDPNQRLENAIAKRRAKRWLTKQHEMDCGIDLSPPAPAHAALPPAPAGARAPAAAPAPPPAPAPAPPPAKPK